MTIDLAALRLEAAREAGLAFSGTCSALGTTSALIDAVLRDSGVDTKYLEHGWMYRAAAAAAGDRQRSIATDGFTVASGALAPTRNWTNAPANAEAYQVFALVPPAEQAGTPISWTRAVNAALKRIFYIDELVIGRGTKRGDRRFSLTRGEVLLVAVVAVVGGTGITITAPTGWTLIRRSNSGTDVALATYWMRSAPGDAETFTWTITSGIAAGGIMAYVDANVNDPVDVSAETATTPASVTATAPAATATVDRGYVLHAYGAKSGTVMAESTTDDKRFDAESHDQAGQAGVMLSDLELTVAGDTVAATATLGVAAINIGQTIVLQPLTDARDIAPISTGTDGNNGAGATTLVLTKPHNLPNDDWTPNEDAIRGVYTRVISSGGVPNDVDQDKGGRTWKPVSINGDLGVELQNAPSQSQLVVVKVHRPYPTLSADTDETACDTERLVAAAVWQLYELLNASAAGLGQYKVEAAEWADRWQDIERRRRPKSVVLT